MSKFWLAKDSAHDLCDYAAHGSVPQSYQVILDLGKWYSFCIFCKSLGSDRVFGIAKKTRSREIGRKLFPGKLRRGYIDTRKFSLYTFEALKPTKRALDQSFNWKTVSYVNFIANWVIKAINYLNMSETTVDDCHLRAERFLFWKDVPAINGMQIAFYKPQSIVFVQQTHV